MWKYESDFINQNRTNIKYTRGFWDGGVHSAGAAGGYWIEVASEHGPWILVSSEAYMLSVGSTVTDAELSAAERLCLGVKQIVSDLNSSAKRRRRS